MALKVITLNGILLCQHLTHFWLALHYDTWCIMMCAQPPCHAWEAAGASESHQYGRLWGSTLWQGETQRSLWVLLLGSYCKINLKTLIYSFQLCKNILESVMYVLITMYNITAITLIPFGRNNIMNVFLSAVPLGIIVVDNDADLETVRKHVNQLHEVSVVSVWSFKIYVWSVTSTS